MKQQQMAALPDPKIVGVADDGTVHDNMSVLEDADIAFDPTRATLDLTKAEKRRTTALMLAIQAYDKIIIKDAEYLKEMHNEARRGEGVVIRPATMHAMVETAINFDAFIEGRLTARLPHAEAGEPEEPKA